MLSRSSSKSYFGSELKRTQSKPALFAKEGSPLVKQLNDTSGKRSKVQGRSTMDGGGEDALQRHNSCSMLSSGKNDRIRPAIMKIDTAVDQHSKDVSTSRLIKKFTSKPESNYQTTKKVVSKKRSSNMLFSKLGFVTQNQAHANSKFLNRKQSEVSSVQTRNQAAYLMGKLSPHSQASIGGGPYFRFDFLDNSELNNHTASSAAKDRQEIKGLGSGELPSSSFRKAFAGRTRAAQKDTMERSQSSTSLPDADSKLGMIQARIDETLERFKELVNIKKDSEKEKLKRFEAIARENGMLREQIRALERRMS